MIRQTGHLIPACSVVAALLGPGLFGWAMAPTVGFLSRSEGMLLMLLIPGLAWIVFGPLCMGVNGWTLGRTIDVCLGAMLPGSVWLGVASVGFALGGRAGWAVGAVLVAHFLMMFRFVEQARLAGVPRARSVLLWLAGLDGAALCLVWIHR